MLRKNSYNVSRVGNMGYSITRKYANSVTLQIFSRSKIVPDAELAYGKQDMITEIWRGNI